MNIFFFSVVNLFMLCAISWYFSASCHPLIHCKLYTFIVIVIQTFKKYSSLIRTSSDDINFVYVSILPTSPLLMYLRHFSRFYSILHSILALVVVYKLTLYHKTSLNICNVMSVHVWQLWCVKNLIKWYS